MIKLSYCHNIKEAIPEIKEEINKQRKYPGEPKYIDLEQLRDEVYSVDFYYHYCFEGGGASEPTDIIIDWLIEDLYLEDRDNDTLTDEDLEELYDGDSDLARDAYYDDIVFYTAPDLAVAYMIDQGIESIEEKTLDKIIKKFENYYVKCTSEFSDITSMADEVLREKDSYVIYA